MFSSVQSLSCVQIFVTPWTAAHQASLSSTNSWSSVKLMSIESVKPSNHFITHVHWIPEAIQPLHPLSSPSPPFFSLSQHHGLLKWVTSSHRVVKVLELQHQPFQWIQDWSPLGWTGWISLQSKGLSRVFFHTTVQKHQFFYAQPSLWSNSHMTTGKTIALTRRTFVGKVMSLLFNMLSRLVVTLMSRF